LIPQLVEIDVYDVIADAQETVRVADGPSSETYGIGGFSWAPAILSRAVITLEILATDLSSGVQKGKASLKLSRRAMKSLPMSRQYKWSGSPIRILHAAGLDYAAATVEFAGYITSHDYDPDTGALTLSLEVNADFLDKPLLWKAMSGLGGINGVAEKIGTLMPAGFGICENIPPVWLDESRWIGMIDGYGNTLAITAAMEGASSFGPAVANYATYAALQAAVDSKAIKPGQWGTCVALGLVAFGAPPAKPIGINATFGAGKSGSLISRAVLTHALAPADVVDANSLAALDTLVPYPVHYWTDGQRNVDDLVEAVARAANATAVVNCQGKLQVIRNSASAPIATLDRAGGQAPRVIGWQTTAPIPPYWQIKVQAERPANVLNLTDVLFVDDLIERGAFLDAETYRAGNIVTMPDGSRWFYINDVPAAGHVPPIGSDGDAWWVNMNGAIEVAWSSITDPDGTKPDDNADVTGENTSKDTNAVGGKPSTVLLSEFAAAQAAISAVDALAKANKNEIDDLVEVYGDTASAAASASAAEQFKNTAQAAAANATNAQQLAQSAQTAAETAQAAAVQKAVDAAASASSAGGFASTASGQATIATQKADAAAQSASTATAKADIATTKAGEASVSASQAATSEVNAAGSSTSAASSATVSTKSASAATLAADFPLTFAQKGALYRTGSWGGGIPVPDSDFVAGSNGNVYKAGGIYGLAYVRPIPSKGRLLRYQARIRAVGADASLSTDFEYGNSPAGPPAGGTFSGFGALPVAAGWIDIDYLIDGRPANWPWAYVMPRLRGIAGTSGTVEVEYFRTVDITDQQIAADYAAASASSAATAATKANEAGVSAAAALTSKTSAETAASKAATSASQASTSETNAAGSASTASQQASLAADAKNAAASSASAANTSAGTASAKADAASQSASAAQASQISAATSAGNANNAAAAANSSYTAAEASRTQAGQYAQSASGSANAASVSAGGAQASAAASSASAAVATDKAAQAASSATLAASYSGALSNLLPNSDFVGAQNNDQAAKAGWSLVSNTPASFFWGADPAEFTIGDEHYLGLLCTERNGDLRGDLVSDWIAVAPNEWAQSTTWLASRECVASIRLQWGNGAGVFLREGPSSEVLVNNAYRGGVNLDGFKRVWCKGQVPSDARFMRLVLSKGPFLANPNNNDLSWMFALRPMVSSGIVEPTVPAPYAPRGGGKGLAAATARIEETAGVAAAANIAVAQRATNLEAAVGGPGGLMARVSTTEQVAIDARNRTAGALYQNTVSVNGGRAQMSLYALNQDGNVVTGIDFVGNTFTFSGNVVVDGTLTTRKLAQNAAQSIQWVRTAGMVSLPTFQQTRIAQITLQKAELFSTLNLLANIRMKSGDDITGFFRLINLNNGATEDEWPITMIGANNNFQVPIALNWMATGWEVGTYTLALDYYNTEADAQSWAEPGCTVTVQEIKRGGT